MKSNDSKNFIIPSREIVQYQSFFRTRSDEEETMECIFYKIKTELYVTCVETLHLLFLIPGSYPPV